LSAHLITLTDADYIASGVERDVYRHPNDPAKILKVMRGQEGGNTRLTFRDISTRLFPNVRLRLIRKEHAEYIRLRLRYPDLALPIAYQYGFAQTDKGLATVSEGVWGADGNIGQTLRQRIKAKSFDEADLVAINTLIAQFFDLGIRAGDMKPHNLVFGQRDGTYQCVLVDGLGDIHALPVRSLGDWANRIGLDDSCKIIAQRTGLTWDRKTRQFAA